MQAISHFLSLLLDLFLFQHQELLMSVFASVFIFKYLETFTKLTHYVSFVLVCTDADQATGFTNHHIRLHNAVCHMNNRKRDTLKC